jgi:hypothetical protein
MICLVGEHRWEDINWDGERHRTTSTRTWGPFAGCFTPVWLPWAVNYRLHTHGTTGGEDVCQPGHLLG